MAKEILFYSKKTGVTDEFLIESAKKIADKDYILERAGKCTDKENRQLCESLLNEDEDFPVLGPKEVDAVMDKIMSDKWLATVYGHYNQIKSNNDDEPKYLEEALRRTVSHMTDVPVKFIRVRLGWYMLVVDINIVFSKDENSLPAYIHMTKKVEGTWDTCGVMKRGHEVD